jgi:hypothetical protein
MHRFAIAAIPLAALLVGCASTGSTGATPSDSALASTAQQVAQPVASPTPTGPCLTKTCITEDAEQGLTGLAAKDNSVITKVKCKSSTVKQPINGTYTVHCTAAYSDGDKWGGIASLLIKKEQILWEPTQYLAGS